MSGVRHWHWTRWLRLGIAAAFVAQGFFGNDAMAYAFAAFFGIQAVFNMGCCGVGTCAPAAPNDSEKVQDITYREIR